MKLIPANQQNHNGFTLIELLLTMLISMTLLSAIYSAYLAQSKAYRNQEIVAELQQNIRAAMNVLVRDIRMARLDKTGSAKAAFVKNKSFSNGASHSETVTTDTTSIAFTADLDSDGSIDLTPEDINSDGNTDMSEMEQIAYRLSGDELQRFSSSSGTTYWQTVAEHIEQLEFRYLDGSNNETATMSQISKVQISILVRAEYPDPEFFNSMTYTSAANNSWATNDNYRRRLQITTVLCRN